MTDMMASEGRRGDGCECVLCFEASAGGGRVGRRRGAEEKKWEKRWWSDTELRGSEEELLGAPAETLHLGT